MLNSEKIQYINIVSQLTYGLAFTYEMAPLFAVFDFNYAHLVNMTIQAMWKIFMRSGREDIDRKLQVSPCVVTKCCSTAMHVDLVCSLEWPYFVALRYFNEISRFITKLSLKILVIILR